MMSTKNKKNKNFNDPYDDDRDVKYDDPAIATTALAFTGTRKRLMDLAEHNSRFSL